MQYIKPDPFFLHCRGCRCGTVGYWLNLIYPIFCSSYSFITLKGLHHEIERD